MVIVWMVGELLKMLANPELLCLLKPVVNSNDFSLLNEHNDNPAKWLCFDRICGQQAVRMSKMIELVGYLIQ